MNVTEWIWKWKTSGSSPGLEEAYFADPSAWPKPKWKVPCIYMYRAISYPEFLDVPRFYMGKGNIQRITSWSLSSDFAMKWATESSTDIVIYASQRPECVAFIPPSCKHHEEQEIAILDYHTRPYHLYNIGGRVKNDAR